MPLLPEHAILPYLSLINILKERGELSFAGVEQAKHHRIRERAQKETLGMVRHKSVFGIPTKLIRPRIGLRILLLHSIPVS